MSQSSKDNNGAKGFSGLESMVSDISEGVRQADPQVPHAPEESLTQSSAQASYNKPSSTQSESSGFPWIIGGILIVLFVIWLVENLEKKSEKPSYSESYTDNVPVSAPVTISDLENKPVFVPKEKIQRSLVRLVDVSSLCELQERLSHRGYYNARIDGIYGPGMKKAVSEYESANNHPMTGIPSVHILEQLRQSEIRNGKINTGHSDKYSSAIPRTGKCIMEKIAEDPGKLNSESNSAKIRDRYITKSTYTSDSKNPRELILLALKYEHGEDVTRDNVKAAELYCKAASMGNADAQFFLGWMYANGRGVSKNDNIASYLFAMAAEQGHHHAQKMKRYGVAPTSILLPACLSNN